MIYITGDTHGDIGRMDIPFIPEEITADDYLIICGDFGFVFFDNVAENKILNTLAKKPFTICFIGGNHENFNALINYPVEEWNGGKVHRIRKNILHLMRGQVFTIEGKTFFTMGGAYSIDRYRRRKDISYWEEELPVQRAAAYQLVVVESEVDSIVGATISWIKNNVVSVVLFGIAGLLLIAIIVLLLIKPSDETMEDVDEKANDKKASKKDKKSKK